MLAYAVFVTVPVRLNSLRVAAGNFLCARILEADILLLFLPYNLSDGKMIEQAEGSSDALTGTACDQRQKRVQIWVVVVLLVSLFVLVRSGKGSGERWKLDSTSSARYLSTAQTGKRLQSEKTYETPEQPTVYLTFDDGPSKLTSQVLDILDKERCESYVFRTWRASESAPCELVKRIVKDGHTLGNHSYNHVYKELYSDFQTFWDQIQRSEDVFADIAGYRPQLVRAPGGTYTNFDAYYYYLMDQAGYIVIDWNVDSGDSKRANVPVNEIWQTVKGSPLEHEINILFHDGSGHESTVEVLPQVISYYKKLGYAFAPLTTQVKPKQFPVGKPKWSRNMSLTHFQELMKETQQYAVSTSSSDGSRSEGS